MASIKKKSSGGGGANWMDTYGDMVTLLLCFFVLLYSISSIDQEKWMLVVRSFNKNALEKIDPSQPDGPAGSNADDGGNGMPALSEVEQDLTDLYQYLQSYVAQNNDTGDIKVSKGDGYVFISFAEAVFFSPDSSVLTPNGQVLLDGIIPALEQCGRSIDELRVLGHTAQLYEDRDNDPIVDWTLSSSRAASVVAYIQMQSDHDRLPPGRMVSEGHGQWRGMGDNSTAEGKAMNRRVEMIVTGKNIDDTLSDNYTQYFTMYESVNGLQSTN